MLETGTLPQGKIHIGPDLWIEFTAHSEAFFYCRGRLAGTFDIQDKAARKLFIIEAVEMGATKRLLARALKISRQTIHNYIKIKEYYGIEGLKNGLGGQTIRPLQSLPEGNIQTGPEFRKQSAFHGAGGKKPASPGEPAGRIFTFGQESPLRVPLGSLPYMKRHDWKETRYAGLFAYMAALVCDYHWVRLLTGYFGLDYKLFLIFMMMAAENKTSIESINDILFTEASTFFGMSGGVTKKEIWESLYRIANKKNSAALLKDYFTFQHRKGVTDSWMWTTVSYSPTGSGKDNNPVCPDVSASPRFLVTYDSRGCVVDFSSRRNTLDPIEYLKALHRRWENELHEFPLMVLKTDRFHTNDFSELAKSGIPFLMYTENVESDTIPEGYARGRETECAASGIRFHLTELSPLKPDTGETVNSKLFHISRETGTADYLAAVWTGPGPLRHEDNTGIAAKAAALIYEFNGRTGKSNMLECLPGLEGGEGDSVHIRNPEIPAVRERIAETEKALENIYAELNNTKAAYNKDGQLRKNSAREKLKNVVVQFESEIFRLNKKLKHLPDMIDVNSFIDDAETNSEADERKILFDFAAVSVWNARRRMAEWLTPYAACNDDPKKMLQAMIDCSGFIKCESGNVKVRLKPCPNPRLHKAQRHFCRKLNALWNQSGMTKKLHMSVAPCD